MAHLDGVPVAVGPVEMVVQPVHRQPIRVSDIVSYHHHLLAAFVNRSPEKHQSKEGTVWKVFELSR